MRVHRAVDLSVVLGPETQVYPGDPVVELSPAAVLGRDGFNLLSVHLGSQSGTHVDAPYHVEADGTRLHETTVGAVLPVSSVPLGETGWWLAAATVTMLRANSEARPAPSPACRRACRSRGRTSTPWCP